MTFKIFCCANFNWYSYESCQVFVKRFDKEIKKRGTEVSSTKESDRESTHIYWKYLNLSLLLPNLFIAYKKWIDTWWQSEKNTLTSLTDTKMFSPLFVILTFTLSYIYSDRFHVKLHTFMLFNDISRVNGTIVNGSQFATGRSRTRATESFPPKAKDDGWRAIIVRRAIRYSVACEGVYWWRRTRRNERRWGEEEGEGE